MASFPTAARFSEMIGKVYDCVLDPPSWDCVLDELRAELGFANAILAINALDGNADFFASAQASRQELTEATALYGPEIIALWGGGRIKHYPVGEPIVLSRVCPIETIYRSRYYREFCRERNWGDALTIRLTDDPVRYGNVTFGQPETRGVVDDGQVDAMRLLAPHIRRAVAIGNILENRTLEAATFVNTVEILQSAVILVDERCGIVYANSAADAMLAKGDPLGERNGTVVVRGEMARYALKGAVTQASLDEAGLGERGLGIPVKGRGGPSVINVMPLRRSRLQPLEVSRRAVAALFAGPTSRDPQMPRDALSLLYDLTPAEIRVCELVSEGTPPVDIARTLGVGISTVRTHLSHVFDKTETKRQADLVRLLSSLRNSA